MIEPTTQPLEGDTPSFPFDNSFAREMDGFYRSARPARAREPRLVAFNRPLAEELGLDGEALSGSRGARVFTGQELPAGAAPIAQVYAGHQFGHFTPQLGDGRALLLGEVVDRHGRRRDIQLKGSGPTHFSRGGDGLSALGPVLREYLVSEAMHALGVPTTRALAAATTGELVHREGPIPGGVMTRVASSHLRVGTFQYFTARRELEQVRQLADYAIARHGPQPARADDPQRYLAFLTGVIERQAVLVSHWMSLGFIHGVMNTDNTAISGETIDYGPCAFMERFDETTVFSSIDHHGRYAYGNQPEIALWNLVRLAECLLPLIDEDEKRSIPAVEAILKRFQPTYEARWTERLRAKLGLETADDGDADLAEGFLSALRGGEVDFTNAFRDLCAAAAGDHEPLRAHFSDPAAIEAWLGRWTERLAAESRSSADRAAAMRAVNPAFIPRNHAVEAVLDAAVTRGDYGPFETLLAVVTHPFDDHPGHEALARPEPKDAPPYQTFCGT